MAAGNRTGRFAWLFVTLAWMGAVAFYAAQSRPRMSLDLPASDPAVVAAYEAALRSHVLWYGFLAIVPPLILWLLWRIFVGRSG